MTTAPTLDIAKPNTERSSAHSGTAPCSADAKSRVEPTQTTDAWMPWLAAPLEGGVFVFNELLELQTLSEHVRHLTDVRDTVSSELADLQQRIDAQLAEAYSAGFSKGLHHWHDALAHQRHCARDALHQLKHRAEFAAHQLLHQWFQTQLEASPDRIADELERTLRAQLPTRPSLHVRYADDAADVAQQLQQQSQVSGWHLTIQHDHELLSGLTLDHPNGRILFDVSSLVQEALHAGGRIASAAETHEELQETRTR